MIELVHLKSLIITGISGDVFFVRVVVGADTDTGFAFTHFYNTTFLSLTSLFRSLI